MTLSPSIQIALQICLAFVIGRLIGRWTSRPKIARLVARVAVICVAIGFAIYVLRSGITWPVALIGFALMLGCLSHGHRGYAPRVFP